jgi:hypothetical protein
LVSLERAIPAAIPPRLKIILSVIYPKHPYHLTCRDHQAPSIWRWPSRYWLQGPLHGFDQLLHKMCPGQRVSHQQNSGILLEGDKEMWAPQPRHWWVYIHVLSKPIKCLDTIIRKISGQKKTLIWKWYRFTSSLMTLCSNLSLIFFTCKVELLIPTFMRLYQS